MNFMLLRRKSKPTIAVASSPTLAVESDTVPFMLVILRKLNFVPVERFCVRNYSIFPCHGAESVQSKMEGKRSFVNGR